MAFDLLVRNGLLVDGSGTPAQRVDIGVQGDRIAAIGDLSHAGNDAPTIIDATGHVVAPGFVDPHGHSDGSVLLDGALASHLHQGFTTQLSGNCGYTLAPLTALGRPGLEPDLRELGLDPAWSTFAGYLAAVDDVALGPNVAFLVGHGTVRAAVLGADDRAPDSAELATMVRHVDEALDAGAIGLSTGLIYAPGIHATPDEVAALVAATARRGALYATHMRNESGGVQAAIDEALATTRAAERQARRPARLQVSHLKAGASEVWGLGPALLVQLEAARSAGLDVAADQYPYTAASTTLATMLPPALLALDPEAAAAALREPETRRRVRDLQASGISGWENVARDPGWAGIVIAHSASRPQWHGRSLADIAATEGGEPVDLALDVLADDRLAVDIVIHCMDEADVEAIMAVPWVSVCTDAEGRRPGHPVLGTGVPHPRAYGSAPRVLGRYVRERAVLSLETAVAKLSSMPARRLGLVRRGEVRPGWFADLVVFDPATVADTATYDRPATYPAGIRDVVVNGTPAIRGGVETGARPGRLLRRGA